MAYGNSTRVTDLMKSIVPVDADADLATISPTEVTNTWLPVIDSLINIELRAHYVVPLRTLGGVYQTELIEVASMLGAGMIVQERFSQVDPNISARGAALYNEALVLLRGMKGDVNANRLRGQTRRSYNHFLDVGLVPAASGVPAATAGTTP